MAVMAVWGFLVYRRLDMRTYYSSLRWSVYDSIRNRNGGTVRCFCCGKHVFWEDASLEHKWPKSFGGTSDWMNLSISHTTCNKNRGNGLHKKLRGRVSYGKIGEYHITCKYLLRCLTKLNGGVPLHA